MYSFMNLMRGIQLPGLDTPLFASLLPVARPSSLIPGLWATRCARPEKKVKRVDVLLCTHGHGDHIGDAVEIVKEAQPAGRRYSGVVWMVGEKRRQANFAMMNKGGTQRSTTSKSLWCMPITPAASRMATN